MVERTRRASEAGKASPVLSPVLSSGSRQSRQRRRESRRPASRSVTLRAMAPEGGRTHVKAGTVAATAWAGPASVLVRTRFVFLWAEVAIEQELRAREGREQIERTQATREERFNMKAELQPAMIAVAACAHSLDALYAELAEQVGRPETRAKGKRRRGRWTKIADVLELSVNAGVDEWRSRLQNLFKKLRNPAVHPDAKDERPVPHPALPTNVPPAYAIYCVESVKESVDLLLEILSTCVESPRPNIEAWARDSQPVVAQLNDLRARGVE
jgi:hypothetical protein